MGKKRRNALEYDVDALKALADSIKASRKEVADGGLINLDIDLDKLKEVVVGLPKKEREALEKYFGLIPGTAAVRKMKNSLERMRKDVAFCDIINRSRTAVYSLMKFEYISVYDRNAHELMQNIISKIDKGDDEDISDIDIIRYFVIFLIFIIDGPKMLYEEGTDTLNEDVEAVANYEVYSTLNSVWNASMHRLEDKSISLYAIKQLISMFEVCDVQAMRKYVGLPVEKEFEEDKPLGTFKEIRLFKERLFPYGAWSVTTSMLYYAIRPKSKIKKFSSAVNKFKRTGWKQIQDYKADGFIILEFSSGIREVSVYDIGGFIFSDPYEVMFLSVTPEVF